MTYKLIKLQAADVAYISEIISWLKELRGPSFNWTPESLQSELLSQNCWCLLSTSGMPDLPLAFVCERTLADAIEWTVLASSPLYSRKGCMRELLRERIQMLRGVGMTREIWLEVHEHNHKAVKLYQQLGFVLQSTRKSYYSDGASALMMTYLI